MDIKEAETGKMFFLQRRNYKQYLDKQFLTHFRSVLYNSFFAKIPLVLSKKFTLKKVVRRTSLRSLPDGMRNRKLKAAVTLEAALVLPVFIFFILNMFSVMEMLRLYGNMAFALNEVGGNVSLYGYVYGWSDEERQSGIIEDVAFTYLYIRNEMLEVLGEEYVEHSPLVGGTDGILFSKAEIMENECIELVTVYEMKVPFLTEAVGKIRTYNSYYCRAWTGYDVSETGELSVYVTENGEVYHTNAECSHLNLTVRKVDRSVLAEFRNEEGVRYTLCELCDAVWSDVVWVTESGVRYHTSEDCAGIKRTVYEITLDTAKEKGYRLCARCGAR